MGSTIENISLSELKKIFNSEEKYLNEARFIFSYNELKYLKNKDFQKEFDVIKGDYVIGENLLLLYKYLKNQINKNDFKTFKILKNEFNSILNKFIVNVSLNDFELESKINEFDKEDHFYIIEKDKIGDSDESFYSEKYGFNFKPYICELY